MLRIISYYFYIHYIIYCILTVSKRKTSIYTLPLNTGGFFIFRNDKTVMLVLVVQETNVSQVLEVGWLVEVQHTSAFTSTIVHLQEVMGPCHTWLELLPTPSTVSLQCCTRFFTNQLQAYLMFRFLFHCSFPRIKLNEKHSGRKSRLQIIFVQAMSPFNSSPM